MAPTTITPAMISASASLPLIALPSGLTVSRFHRPVVATSGAERQMERAEAYAASATTPVVPTRTPNPFRGVQARLELTYGVPRTVVWSRAGE